MPRNTIIDFASYTEDLCRRHKEILHDKNGHIHFVDSGAEKDTSLDSKLYYPAVILEKGSYQFAGDNAGYRKEHDYVMFILSHVKDKGDYDEIRTALQTCERITDELFNQILLDKQKHRYKFLTGFSLTGVEVEKVENTDASLYGVMSVFSLGVSYLPVNCQDVFLPE